MTTANAETLPAPAFATTQRRYPREPAFEPPPWFAGSTERRLAGRAAALWAEHQRAGGIPDALRFIRALTAGSPDGGNYIRLDCGRPTLSVEQVGDTVAATFGLFIGPLDVGALAAKLAVACATSRRTGMPTAFEGGFARTAGQAATLLTRGIVLPLAGPGGTIVAMLAVVTWKEALTTAASGRLRRELALAGAPFARPAVGPCLEIWR